MADQGSDDQSHRDSLHDLLEDLALSPQLDRPSTNRSSEWPLSSSQPSTLRQASPLRIGPSLRSIPQPRSLSSGLMGSHSANDSASGSSNFSTLFNTPGRSLISSGPPTASISVNTAQASMSSAPPSSSSRPLAALTSPSSSSRRATHSSSHSPAPPKRRRRMANAEKDIDDPSTSRGQNGMGESASLQTPVALSRLFATSDLSPSEFSRGQSFTRSASATSDVKPLVVDTSSLGGHLLHRGLIGGCHSDIIIHAFGNSYPLHKLLLDRCPFFSTAFSGPWSESSAREMALHPEDIDSNITQAAFELALRRLYGTISPAEEDKEAIGLFATGCWLDMQDLVDSAVDSMLRQMQPSGLVPLIKLVTSNYYGKAGNRILDSAKAMLFRDGWEMSYSGWDGISGEIVREIVGADAFFVPSEWERWYLTVRLLNRRLKAKALEAGLILPNGDYTQPRPMSLRFDALRFDTVYRRNSALNGRQISRGDEAWLALYTSPDISPLLVLLDEGIHYIHLRFEQLQQIRNQRDILGVPVLPEKVISNALWMSMELRQRVLNATEAELELGLSEQAEEQPEEEAEPEPANAKGKQPEREPSDVESDVMESGSWDGNGMPRKFWIPSTDSTHIIGGTAEAYVAATNTSPSHATYHMSRLSASLDPQDVQWAADFMASGGDFASGLMRPASAGETTNQIRYSHYPPFRFSAEFPNPRSLKEKKRVYSQTVWYAGSMWNLYIQRVNTSKSTQLGIYLHRAKDKEGSEDINNLASVDDRIGLLEREIFMRRNHRRSQAWRAVRSARGEDIIGDQDDSSGDGCDHDAPVVPGSTEASAHSSSRRPDNLVKTHKTSQSSPLLTLSEPLLDRPFALDMDEEDDDLAKISKKINVSTLPPYVDGRPTIKTYFKIFAPSKAGRMLSVYESAPDRFNFSQSWGWKSSTMVLDEGVLGYDGVHKNKDGRLRFMVVIGMILPPLTIDEANPYSPGNV